jgi:hypothetical protein
MRVSSTLRLADAPGLLQAIAFAGIAISVSQVMAETGKPAIKHDASELDYYGYATDSDVTDGDGEQAPKNAVEVSTRHCDSLGLGCSGTGLSYAPGRPQKPHRQMPGDINRGDCPPYRYTLSDCERAGNPHCVASWAKLSITPKYSAGYVGGGAALGGRSRYCSEGVWGLDYHGLFPYRRVWMRWTSGCEQGGEGAYKTDGHTGPFARH